MRRTFRIGAAAAVLAGVALLAAGPASAQTAGAALDVPLVLEGLPRQSLGWKDHGKPRTCEGVWLRDLLVKAGAPTGEAVRGPALLAVVLVEARDGYRLAFSLGEIDAGLGAAPLLVADRCDRKPLAEGEGPLRIIAGGEARGARSIRQVERIKLVNFPG